MSFNYQDLWTYIADPVQTYGPRILVALAILVAAWIIGKILAMIVSGLINRTRLGRRARKGGERLGSAIGKAVFWVVMLFAMPMALQHLGMTSVLEPVQGMLDKMLGVLPNVIGAAVVFGIGLAVANVARQAISSVLEAANADNLAARYGFASTEGGTGLSGALGMLVFVLIAIPVAIAALDVLGIAAVSEPAKAMLGKVFDAIPRILVAAIILGLAFVIARFAANALKGVLSGVGLDSVADRSGLLPQNAPEASTIVSRIAFIAIMALGLIEAANQLDFGILSTAMTEIVKLGGNILLGALIIGFGVYAANFIAAAVRQSGASPTITSMMRMAIILLAAAMGLQRMGLAESIVTSGFTLLLGGLAVGAAIAIGLGGRDAAARLLDRWGRDL